MSDFPALRANEYRDAWCGQVLGDRVGETVRVAGWVHRRRDPRTRLRRSSSRTGCAPRTC
jgi:hypothetical protein